MTRSPAPVSPVHHGDLVGYAQEIGVRPVVARSAAPERSAEGCRDR
ncbi:hypothetical protein ACIBF6_31225 [Streptosporangium amethystogenes]